MTNISRILDRFEREGGTSLEEVLTAAELDAIRNSWVLPEICEARFSDEVVSIKLEE